jgi:transcriptional regulator with XRE-family HTH domain
MIDKSVPFTVRRARLLLGLTQMQFAELYGVDEAKVYQWEIGSLSPSPEIWARLRNIILKASSLVDADLVRACPICKVIVDMEDLMSPIVASKGIIEAIQAVGASGEKDKPFDAADLACNGPDYEISGARALEIIQTDPRWHSGEIVYVEAHCFSCALGYVWQDAMIAPLPERVAAIIEFIPSKRGPEGGFWVHPFALEDMPFNRP